MPDILNTLPFVSIILSVAVVLGGLAFRRTQIKELGRLQEQVIATYKSESEAQEQQIKRISRENVAMRAAFKHLGIEFEIEDSEITLIQNEHSTNRTRIVRVSVKEEKP